MKDNGIGIEKPDELGKGESYGFSLIKSFQKKLEADLMIKTEDGTCIDIRINNYKKVA